MKLSTRLIGDSIIELTVEANGASIVSDVCDLYGKVDESILTNLVEVLGELVEHNEKIERM